MVGSLCFDIELVFTLLKKNSFKPNCHILFKMYQKVFQMKYAGRSGTVLDTVCRNIRNKCEYCVREVQCYQVIVQNILILL